MPTGRKTPTQTQTSRTSLPGQLACGCLQVPGPADVLVIARVQSFGRGQPQLL